MSSTPWEVRLHSLLVRLFGASALSAKRLAITASSAIVLTLAFAALAYPLKAEDAGTLEFGAAVIAFAIWYAMFSLTYATRNIAALSARSRRRYWREIRRIVALHYLFVTILFVVGAISAAIYVMLQWFWLLVGADVVIGILGVDIIPMLADVLIALGILWVCVVSLPFVVFYALAALVGLLNLMRMRKPQSASPAGTPTASAA
jgi:hypothetical protein